jgi:8-oxo-dGTP pyrophosphatase MutT (NUDIX family)
VKPSIWFDAKHTHAAAGVVLITSDGRLILQLRDDIPTIDNPGMITPFGGGAEPGETPPQCAVRELGEETGLRADPANLRYLGEVSKVDFRGNRTACVFYLLEAIDPAALNVAEGAPVVMTLAEVSSDPRSTPFCKELAAKVAAIFPTPQV